MANKFIPTPEQLQQIESLCKTSESYAEISRNTGISITIITRIVKENCWDDFLVLNRERARKNKGTSQKPVASHVPSQKGTKINNSSMVFYNGIAPLPSAFSSDNELSYFEEQNQLYERIKHDGILQD